MAREMGLKLAEIAGTGPGGIVTENDVRGAAGMEPREPAPADITASLTQSIPFAGKRQVSARRLMESLRNTAQATLFAEVEADELGRFWERLKAGFELTVTDLLIAAVARALRRHPLLNSTLMGDEILLLDPINIGFTVGVEDGVVVAVAHNANLWSLRELAAGTRRIIQEAREGGLKVSQMVGATFTITHLEDHGVDAFTSIVHPPEVASLAVGRIAEKLVLHDGRVVSRATLTLSLTIDECIVDVVAGARFLDTLREMLEHPDEYLG
jgi:pyruvate dehydrogenase E2 component (dihydrolipoamide acetyltransferase)